MKRLMSFFTLFLIVQWGIFAQDNDIPEDNVHVKAEQENIQKDYSSFYWLDQQEQTAQTQQDTVVENYQDDQMNINNDQPDQDTVTNNTGNTGETNDQYANEYEEPKNDDQMVKDDKQYETRKNKEKTYGKEGHASADHQKTIKQAILHEMVSKGYELKKEDPELLVSFKITDKKGEMSGFSTNDGNIDTANNQESIEVEKGAIQVSITDRETGEMVWRGLVENVYSAENQTNITENKEFEKEEIKSIKAVIAMFDRFDLQATAAMTE